MTWLEIYLGTGLLLFILFISLFIKDTLKDGFITLEDVYIVVFLLFSCILAWPLVIMSLPLVFFSCTDYMQKPVIKWKKAMYKKGQLFKCVRNSKIVKITNINEPETCIFRYTLTFVADGKYVCYNEDNVEDDFVKVPEGKMTDAIFGN